MRPLPELVNKVVELILYDANYIEAEKIFEEIIDPVEKIHARFFISWVHNQYDDYNKVKNDIDEFHKAIGSFPNTLENFVAQFGYYFYTGGVYRGGFVLSPGIMIDKNWRVNYQKAVDLVNDYEDYLREHNTWYYYVCLIFKYNMEYALASTENEKLNFLSQSINQAKLISTDNEQMIWIPNYIYGAYCVRIGKLEEAEEIFNRKPKQTNYFANFTLLLAKSIVYYLRGDLNKAISLSKESLEYCVINNDKLAISAVNSQLAIYYEEKGDFIKAKQILIDIIDVRKSFSNQIWIAVAYYNLIRFLTNRYELTRDKSFIKEANDYFLVLQELHLNATEDVRVSIYLKMSQATIFKFGRLAEKLKSYEMLKELIDLYPFYNQMKIDLIELLIDEAKSNTENPQAFDEIIAELDKLIDDISQMNIFSEENGSILRYVQHKLLISKYLFLIKKQTQEALDILYSLENQLSNYDLPELMEKLKVEINQMTIQIESVSNKTIHERLEQLEVANYLKLVRELNELSK